MLNSSELQKRLYDSIRSNKCTNKGCLSNGEDNLEVAWFGKQYDEKCLTCSSCYIMNDEAVRKSIPTAFNVLPLRYGCPDSAPFWQSSHRRPKYTRRRSYRPSGRRLT